MTGLLETPLLGQTAWLWLSFFVIVAGLLAFDLGVLHKGDRAIEVRESVLLSAGYIAAGLLFGIWIWWQLGAQSAAEYVTGYLIEKSLSIDNVFVIALIFTHLAIPSHYQHRVLFWGIMGVIVLRAIMIGLGGALVHELSWILYLFGAFLVVTGLRMWRLADHTPDIARSPLLRLPRRVLRVTPELHGNAFVVRAPDASGASVLWATPLLLALCMVEFADVVFAIDSVPAVFAITSDPFIVYTSNIFAILGLRALYFALAATIHRFRYLKHALALILVFIGAKICLVDVVGKVPPAVSLGVTVALLAGGIAVSLWRTRRGDAAANEPDTAPRTHSVVER